MEAVSAGANVITFIDLGLKSARFIYQVLSNYRNGSQQTKALASAVKDLQTVLTQIRGCEVLDDPQADNQTIADHVKACSEDLQRYEKRIQEAQPDPNASKIKQAWKKSVTPILREKSSKLIWKEVNHHFNVLQSQLHLLQL